MSTNTGSAAVVAIDLLAPKREALGEGPRISCPGKSAIVGCRAGGRLLVLDHHHRLIRPRGHVGGSWIVAFPWSSTSIVVWIVFMRVTFVARKPLPYGALFVP